MPQFNRREPEQIEEKVRQTEKEYMLNKNSRKK